MNYIITDRQFNLIFEQLDYGLKTAPSDATQTNIRTPSGKTVQSRPLTKTDIGYSKIYYNDGLDWKQVFENIKEEAYGPAGIAITTILSLIPQTKVISPVIFGTILAYDAYQLYQEPNNWVHYLWVIIDALMVLSTSPRQWAVSFANLIKGMPGIKSFGELANWLVKTKAGKILLEQSLNIGSKINQIIKIVWESIQKIWQKTGAQYLWNKLDALVKFIEIKVTGFTKMISTFLKEKAGTSTAQVVTQGSTYTGSQLFGKGVAEYVKNKTMSVGTGAFITVINNMFDYGGSLANLPNLENVKPDPKYLALAKEKYGSQKLI